MFKQKLKEILELVLEAVEKTDTYISYRYGNQSETLSVIVGEEVFTASDDRYMEKCMDEIREALLKLTK